MRSRWIWISGVVVVGGIAYVVTRKPTTTAAAFVPAGTTIPTKEINIEGSGTKTTHTQEAVLVQTTSAPGPSGTVRDYRINYQAPTGEAATTASSGGVGGYGSGTDARDAYPTPIL